MTYRRPYPLMHLRVTGEDIAARRMEYGLSILSVAEMSGLSDNTVRRVEGNTPRKKDIPTKGAIYTVVSALEAYSHEVLAREKTPLLSVVNEASLYRAIDRAASDAMLVDSVHVRSNQREYCTARQIAFRILHGFLSRKEASIAIGFDRASTLEMERNAERWSEWIKMRALIAESRVRAAILQGRIDNPASSVYLDGKRIMLTSRRSKT